MTKNELNQLRPGDKIAYEVAKTATRGRILSVWRDDLIQVKWNDNTTDTLMIDDDTAKHLRKL